MSVPATAQFISGVAVRFLLDARPRRQVVQGRLRLLVPVGLGMLVIVMPQAYLELRSTGEVPGDLAAFYPQ